MPTRRGYAPCVSALCRAPTCLVIPVSNRCRLYRRRRQPHADWGNALRNAGRDLSPVFRHSRSACLALLILLKLLRSICRSGGPFKLLERRPDGRIVVPRAVLAQLGTGDAVRGEQLVERLTSEMQSRRVLVTSRARQR